jgi:hypothetical protein
VELAILIQEEVFYEGYMKAIKEDVILAQLLSKW